MLLIKVFVVFFFMVSLALNGLVLVLNPWLLPFGLLLAFVSGQCLNLGLELKIPFFDQTNQKIGEFFRSIGVESMSDESR